MRYSVLTYIFNNYEIVHEIQEKDSEAEYILVTDSQELTSKTWNVIVDESLRSLSPFDKTFEVRYNCFKYCNTDICIRIDGSVGILHNLKPLVDIFESGSYDAALMIHPKNSNFIEEYEDWISVRGYSKKRADQCLSYMASKGYDFNYKGLFQLSFAIQRRNSLTVEIDTKTKDILKEIGENGCYERLDQIPFSFVMNTYFNHIKILPVSEQIYRSYYFQWYKHRSDCVILPFKESITEPIRRYVFNNMRECLCLYAPPIQKEISSRERYVESVTYDLVYSLQNKNKKRLKTIRKLICLNIIAIFVFVLTIVLLLLVR